MTPLPGDPPGTVYYFNPVRCSDCGWEGMVIERNPTPFPVMRRSCGFCGKHHLEDRDPDPDDEGFYMGSRPAEQLVAWSMREHARSRKQRVMQRIRGGFKFVTGKRGDN